MLAILTVCLVGMLNIVYGQNYAFDPLLTKCVVHHDERRVIVASGKECDGFNDSIIYYSNQGYEIKATVTTSLGIVMYMQK
jgi:hypothetical protein